MSAKDKIERVKSLPAKDKLEMENYEEKFSKDECWIDIQIKNDIIGDVSRGQRGYERNLDGLLSHLQNFYKSLGDSNKKK